MAHDLYTASVSATAGAVRSDDGALALDVREATSSQDGSATNPEQLMAAALGSCLLESLKIATSTTGGNGDDVQVQTQVTLSEAEGAGYSARYELSVTLPDAGTDPEAVLQQALSLCPFTKTINADSLDVHLA
ncbi:OsmC family protein [Kineococcus sp. SYSU DK002]|uniref:OsmC family protein n=1 Tax=Kineococcus sp. SYSU DK002 TaxID=3383123 RepID=UPI003D7C46C1